MQPFQPPFDTEPLAGIGGQISARSEDFVVDEVQLYDWSGEGDHLMVRFRKTGMNTQFAVKAIARAAGVDARDIGVAGQKDRWAVTSQCVSIPKRSAPVEEWSLPGQGRKPYERPASAPAPAPTPQARPAAPAWTSGAADAPF